MREPRPDWSPLGVNFKILDEHPYLFIYRIPHSPPPGGVSFAAVVWSRHATRTKQLLRRRLQPWTNCVGKCLKTSNHDQKPTKTTSCTSFPLSMLENSKIQTSVTRKVLSQHCTGVGRGKMCGEQNFPTLMAKVVVLVYCYHISLIMF